LLLELSADGVANNQTLDLVIFTSPTLDPNGTPIQLVGEEEMLLTILLPAGTMQGSVEAYGMDCNGDTLVESTYMVFMNNDSLEMGFLEASLEFEYCEEEEEEEEEEGYEWDDDLEVEALASYLDSLCTGQGTNDEPWIYCGLLESLNGCLGGDSLACEDLFEWLDDVEWTWQEEEEEEEEEDCEAEFVVVQAFDQDSNLVANELFVFVLDFDEEEDLFWSFGDEGTSTDPFPTWTYDSDGPYELCLTVGDEDGDCEDTFCFTLSVDSMGWWGGIEGGFSITVLDGENMGTVSVPNADDFSHSLKVFPNPTSDHVWVEWTPWTQTEAVLDILGMDGKVVQSLDAGQLLGKQQLSVSVEDLGPGMYFLRVTQGARVVTQKFFIR